MSQEKSEFDVLKMNIANMREQLVPLLGIDTEKFIQILVNFLSGKEKLIKASRASLFSEIQKAAGMRLFIDGQEASLVPFKDSVKLMVGYKGILKMVRNSGELASINAGVVYEKDSFEYFVDELGEHVKHVPSFIKERGKPTQTYCIARTKGNNEPYIEVMTEDDIQACKKVSRAGEDSPWNGPFADEMRKKTVIRRISKRLPMSTDVNMALIDDDDEPDNTPTEPQPEKTTSSRLESAVGVTPESVRQPYSNGLPPVEPALDTFSQTVTGALEFITVKDVPTPKDPSKSRRYSCKIAGVFYGTWNLETYRQLEDAYNKRQHVTLKYVTMMNTKTPPQPYNDILTVTTVSSEPVQQVAQEEIPI